MSELESRLGLVLEGGGMRGIYTTGVLDEFLEQGIKVDGLVGVSAGILHGVTYISEQYGRNVRYMVKYVRGKIAVNVLRLLEYRDKASGNCGVFFKNTFEERKVALLF